MDSYVSDPFGTVCDSHDTANAVEPPSHAPVCRFDKKFMTVSEKQDPDTGYDANGKRYHCGTDDKKKQVNPNL